MGQVYIPQELERAILRHYDGSVSDVVDELLRQQLYEAGLMDEDGNYDPDGADDGVINL